MAQLIQAAAAFEEKIFDVADGLARSGIAGLELELSALPGEVLENGVRPVDIAAARGGDLPLAEGEDRVVSAIGTRPEDARERALVDDLQHRGRAEHLDAAVEPARVVAGRRVAAALRRALELGV